MLGVEFFPQKLYSPCMVYIRVEYIMFDISMYDLSGLPNKVTYCNWRIGMVFNGTENDKFSHHHNISSVIIMNLIITYTHCSDW